MGTREYTHTPVLLREALEALSVRPEGCYADGTFGGGGHSRAILRQLGPGGRLFCVDKDARALEELPKDDPRVQGIQSDYRYLANWLDYYGVEGLDGLLVDLGVSSYHLDTPSRGFSYRFQGPLDMRMNQQSGRTASELLNAASLTELTRIFRDYGELHEANRLALAICSERNVTPYVEVPDLQRTLERVYGRAADQWGLQSKVFQALRIAVNDELGALSSLLQMLPQLLKVGGRVVVISYHSLEDRLVKQYLRGATQTPIQEQRLLGVADYAVEEVYRKVITPDAAELAQNRRARSAKMRVGVRKC